MVYYLLAVSERHAIIEDHSSSCDSLAYSVTWSRGVSLAMQANVAGTDSISTILFLLHFVCHARRLVACATHGFVLGVVRYGVARRFLFGLGRTFCHGGVGLEFASAAYRVWLSSECFCCEHRLQLLDAGGSFGLDWRSSFCEINDMNTANKIAAHNAGWRSQFRFPGSRHWSGVCEFWR